MLYGVGMDTNTQQLASGARPDLFCYSDMGYTDGKARIAWVASKSDFTKQTGATWGVRVAGGDDPAALALLPKGYKPTGNLAFDAAKFQRKARLSIY